MLLPNVTLRRLNEFAEETGVGRRHDALAAVFSIAQAVIRDTEAGSEQRLAYKTPDGKSRISVADLMAVHMSLARDLHDQRTAWMHADVDTHALDGVIEYVKDKGLYTSGSRKSEAATAVMYGPPRSPRRSRQAPAGSGSGPARRSDRHAAPAAGSLPSD